MWETFLITSKVSKRAGKGRKRAHMLKRMRTYLGVIFAIFARDVKRVLRNPVALVIALGMIVMPSAYAWYVVAANWDPYSNTADMLVAVANEDAGADSPETGHLDVGAQVVAQLHDNHEMAGNSPTPRRP